MSLSENRMLNCESENEDDWGSDFEDSDNHPYSQEIEDNRINEIREANLLRELSNNMNDLNTTSDDITQIVGMTAENSVAKDKKTGAIHKTGFTYLSSMHNVNINKSNQANKQNSESSDIPQNEVSENAYENVKQMNNLQKHMVRQPSDSDNLSPNQVVNDMQQRKQGLTNETASKNTPRKLKPEAFNFLNKLSKSKEPSTKSEENGMNANKIRKHLMPTAFSYAENLRQTQMGHFITTPDPNSNELSNNTSIEPHSESMSGNYETINENVASGVSNDTRSQDYNSIIDETVKPPLPSRPPPVFKYPLGTFSNPNSVPSEDVIQNTLPPELPRSLPARSKIMHSVSAPESSLGNVNILENRLSYPDKKRQPTARPIHNKPFRPLPSLPIATVEKTETSVPQPDMFPFQYPRPILNTLKTSEVIPYEASIIPGTSNSTAMQSIYPTEELMLNETRDHHTANNSVIQKEVFLTPQQRLAQIITNQSSVTKDVLVSQHRVTSAIASRIAKSQNIIDPKEKKTDEPSHIIPHEQQDTNSRMISRRSVQYEEPLKEDNIEPKLSNFETRENTNPRRFTDQEDIINFISRPMLPEKAIPMQRSVSCTSLVQSIKGLSVWGKPEKSKRTSDGPYYPKKSSKDTSPVSLKKAPFPKPSSITVIPASEAPDPYHGKNHIPAAEEKNMLMQYPWYHNVDSKETQLRLLIWVMMVHSL